MRTFDPSTWTWGYELEVSDVRRVPLPPGLGRWDGCERDIVNTQGQHRGVAADPLGLAPPVGGEINTPPTRGWQGQLDAIDDILSFFRKRGDTPAVGPTAHGHVHVHVPGLIDDVEALKRLTDYVLANQEDMVAICGQFREFTDMTPAAKRYMKTDGGRLMPAWMCANIMSRAESFDDFIRLQCCGKDGKSMGRPFRYAINTYCLKHTQTVEFRMFRGSLERPYLASAFQAVEMFMNQALNSPDPVPFRRCGVVSRPFLSIDFAPMQWSRELWDGLQATKHPASRGKKDRKFVEVS